MIFRSSQFKTAKACMAKSYYRYELGLAKRGSGKKNIDLFFGTIVHKAIEIMLTVGKEKAFDYMDKLTWPKSSSKSKNIAKVLVNLFDFKFKDKVISCEESFSYQLNDDFKMVGRFDLIAESAGTIYVADYKTSVPYYLLMKPDDQFIMYYIAAKALHGVDKVVIYNLDPSCCNVTVSFITYTDEEIENWKKETIAFLSFYKQCIENKTVVKDGGSCMAYGKRCTYIDLCTASNAIRESLIAGMFEIDEEQKNLSW